MLLRILLNSEKWTRVVSAAATATLSSLPSLLPSPSSPKQLHAALAVLCLLGSYS